MSQQPDHELEVLEDDQNVPPRPEEDIADAGSAQPASDAQGSDGADAFDGSGAPAEMTMLEHAGGAQPVERLVATWYATVLADPVLQPLFGAGAPEHVPHLAAFLVEVFGGPTRYTDDLGGFPALLEHHRGLAITETQRARFVELFLAAADAVGMPDDERFRSALRAYLDFGTEVAAVNSHARNADELHECQEVPVWQW